MHHKARYRRYPRWWLVLEKSGDTDDEDVEIISDIYGRDALNFKSKLLFTKTIDEPVEEVVDALGSL
jgi:hypothetical protein